MSPENAVEGLTGLTRILSSLRFNADEFLSIDQLPPPKKTPAKPEPELERPKPAAIRQVGIADQIAIRSYVLGKSGEESVWGSHQ